MKLARLFILATAILLFGLLPLAVRANQDAHHPHKHSSIADPIPRTGNQPLLVVLADFPDEPGLFTGTDWKEFIATDQLSLKKYYYEVSYNQLNYQGAIVGMRDQTPVINSTGVDYVRLPNNIGYYADNDYGNNTGNWPHNSGGMVRDALVQLDNEGFDFSPYANANNKVENLIVIFGGISSRETGDANAAIQPTAYRISDMGLPGGYTSSGGYNFNNYTICADRTNVQQAPLGVCVHEHGHALGLPDLYDLYFGTIGVGYAGLMGYGTFAGDPEGLNHIGAFSRVYAGWAKFGVPLPSPAQQTYTEFDMMPAESHSDFLKIGSFGRPDEYFLVENRQPIGFDAGMENSTTNLCRGIFIWHVDMDIVNNYLYRVNSTPSTVAGNPPHQGVRLVEADGNADMTSGVSSYGECDDTWTPGQTFTGAAANYWDGTSSNAELEIMSQNADGSVTVRIGRLTLNHRSDLQTITLPIPTAVQAVAVSAESQPTTAPSLTLALIMLSCLTAPLVVQRMRIEGRMS